MICLSICFLLFSPSPIPPLLLPSSSPYQFSPSPFSLIGGYYISQRIRLASLTEIVWPFVSLLYWCGGRWSGQMLHVTIQGPGPLTLLILISKGCCSCLHRQRQLKARQPCLADRKMGKKRMCYSLHAYSAPPIPIYSLATIAAQEAEKCSSSLGGLVSSSSFCCHSSCGE